MSLESLKTKVGLLIEKAQSGGNTAELEAIIDNSGVLDSTEGTVEEKVEQLVEKAEAENLWYEMTKHAVEFTSGFKDSTVIKKLPRADFSNVVKFADFFNNSTIEEIDFYIDCKSCTNTARMFANTPNLKRIVGINTSAVTSIGNMFAFSAIEEIEQPLDVLQTSVSAANKINFDATSNLREIRFVENGGIRVKITFVSPYLSDESIQSIIGGLADLTGTTAQLLILHNDIVLKLTEEQWTQIENKNWNVG